MVSSSINTSLNCFDDSNKVQIHKRKRGTTIHYQPGIIHMDNRLPDPTRRLIPDLTSNGSIIFPRDFDIFLPYLSLTIACKYTDVNGNLSVNCKPIITIRATQKTKYPSQSPTTARFYVEVSKLTKCMGCTVQKRITKTQT
jgi:hypothetical protein